MAIKLLIVFFICVTVSVAVKSKPSGKLNVENEKLSVSNSKSLRHDNREKRQINYVYYPYYPYQSYYVKPNIQRPTKQPHRRSTTTQRYSIWDLSRKRRSAESDDANDIRKRRQIDDDDIDFDYYPYNLRQLSGERENDAEPRNLKPYSMWDLTRRKRNALDELDKSKL